MYSVFVSPMNFNAPDYKITIHTLTLNLNKKKALDGNLIKKKKSLTRKLNEKTAKTKKKCGKIK
jgi:hypothetical protein